MPAARILLRRLWQGCYGVTAGAFVAIPAAVLGDDPPSIKIVLALCGAILFAGATGVLLEMREHSLFPGVDDDG